MTPDTLLFRQVNPSWVRSGRVTSQAFTPTKKDKKRLSVYDGDKITAEDAWKHYVRELELVSIGVLAVTVAECDSQTLPVEPDPDRFPAHAVIKFDNNSNAQIERKAKHLSNAQTERKAKHLKRLAETRGWQYQAEES